MQAPPCLQPRDKVTIVSPAGKITADLLDRAAAVLQSWGLRVAVGNHAADTWRGLAGTDDRRRTDLQAAIDDPDTRAILCARGGYGCGRIIDNIDCAPLLAAPKWVAGFSDITLLHARLQRLGLQSIHSAMPQTFAAGETDNRSLHTLRQALFGTLTGYRIAPHPLNRHGHAHGTLVGGNLSLLLNIAATPDDCLPDDAILFVEDVGECYYQVDRMLGNLQRSGKLSRLKGLVAGHFTRLKVDRLMGDTTACELIDAYARPLGIPVCYDFPAGHSTPNCALYLGREVHLQVEEKEVALTFAR